MPERGWNSVTVPGAVAGWAALVRRFGRLRLSEIAAPAIGYAREGYPVSPIVAALWQRSADTLRGEPGFADCFLPGGRAPRAGEVFRSEAHARTLESIAESGGESFYHGELARQLVADAERHGGGMRLEDLASHQADWIDTVAQPYASGVVHELPPNGQGVATLIGLGILEALGEPGLGGGAESPERVHLAIEATKLALADLDQFVADPDHMNVAMTDLLDPDYIASRARLVDPRRAGDPGFGAPRRGGTVCLSAADSDGMMISFIQSNYMGFGSGVVVPGTGISLQNRGAGFIVEPGHPNQVGPRKRPFQTIIPGFAMDKEGAPLVAFGLMGGRMQAQGHLQMAQRLLALGQNPQAACDAPRWRIVGGRRVAVEPGMDPGLMAALSALGHEIVVERPEDSFAFGGAQIVQRIDGGYVAGSDPRKDGQAAGI